MGDERLEAVLRRVEDLEAEGRRWRRAAMALMLSAVALTTLGSAVPRGRVVEAQKFVLKDTAVVALPGRRPPPNHKIATPRLHKGASHSPLRTSPTCGEPLPPTRISTRT